MDILNFTGISTLICAFLILLFCIIFKKENFLDVRSVIKRHLALFENCKSQYWIFYFLPAVLATGISLIYRAQETFYSNLSVILSIILSILLAILSILATKDYTSADKDCDSEEKKRRKERLKISIKETNNVILFDTLLCVVLLLYNLIITIILESEIKLFVFTNIFTGIACYLFIVVLLNLLLVIKRISKLIDIGIDI